MVTRRRKGKEAVAAIEVDPELSVAESDEVLAEEIHSSFGTSAVEKVAPAGPTASGMLARRVVLGAIIGAVLLVPLFVDATHANWISYALVFVVVGLSVNILMGYAGQISLGHQAFVGVGAFTSAVLVTDHHLTFWVAFALSGLTGAFSALILGFVALRLKGLFLALVTLAYGTLAQNTLFNYAALTGGGAGKAAARPPGFDSPSNRPYIYLCFLVLAVLMFIDWRLVRSKAGRAIFAIRENELSAASFGINVTGYKLIAFVLSGFFAGLGGSLFAHQQEFVVSASFNFGLALTFVLMVVVGGLGSRVGVFIGSAFFALFPLVLSRFSKYTDLAGALLLLLTLTAFPGGIAQQIAPLLHWFGGAPLRGHHKAQLVATGGAGVRP